MNILLVEDYHLDAQLIQDIIYEFDTDNEFIVIWEKSLEKGNLRAK